MPIFGTANDDIITPGAISFGVTGFPTAAADTIYGFEGRDFIDGGGGADTMRGHDGDDTYVVDNAGDEIDGEFDDSLGGVDSVRSTISIDFASFEDGLALENLTLLGSTGLSGTGNARGNTIIGNSGSNSIRGLDGNDLIRAGGGSDLLDGGNGRDMVRGQGGGDVITGGFDADVLIGGSGNDRFEFRTLLGSNPTARDTLRSGDGGQAFDNPGAPPGDTIDVSGIDANADPSAHGNQAFVFGGVLGAGACAPKGTLWVTNVGSDTFVRGNVDNDCAPEFELEIEDGAVPASAYTAADFIL